MNTTENNILIAEFREYKQPIENYFEIFKGQPLIYKDRLLFHSSWDWLMPVVEKIESFIFEDDEYYNFNILGGCYVIVISSHGNELITSDRGQSKLECTYNAVVDFIKWHNENSAKKE